MTLSAQHSSRTALVTESDCDLAEFHRVVSATTDPADYPYSSSVESNVLFYDAATLDTAGDRVGLQDEIARALLDGPGIVVFRGAVTSDHAFREVTEYFESVVERQRRDGTGSGDHFAKPGANDRVWNALQKLALEAPELFTRYYSNDVLALVAEAWLGPMYQVTSAVNVVNPGGAAQNPHRDYHLGFMDPATASRFRAHVHRLSPALTLQGAVAHCDMPIESGPTMYLPFSQHYEPGYVAFGLPAFQEYFAQNYVQLPLSKGDAVFFNPALFHAAGHNTSTSIKRMANLLQISSAFGRAMDSVDREAIVTSIYPSLQEFAATHGERSVANVVAASAEAYAFPTNLDLDPPLTGLAAETQAELVHRALDENLSPDEFADEAAAMSTRHRP
ncbi:phytanoyl-CoA dioxygenase family protein [Rhodococcus sp. MEB064]|uniref:phytanoyl-CoA dioxygenase family protein n=1 Tax=Rhodococcus sp. MEB064 TaxID=1587522 RepID=UPI0005AC6B4A|nr:phytanoyl-CoA dioxygenase family protein [Rhodococcus sp. MEB064]KIQ19530.1 phytanoyl-CoA dioxygenase [Rhodococcus sp. MEB064]